MSDKPIIFSGEMIWALLRGRKTMTRRVLKDAPIGEGGHGWKAYNEGDKLVVQWPGFDAGAMERTVEERVIRPPYDIGDRLWVREAHAIYSAHGQHRNDDRRWGPWGGLPTQARPDGTEIAYYREGFDRCDPGRWRPSIHMPRWASRLTLIVTDVRVERVQDISEEDAKAEGVQPAPGGMWSAADGQAGTTPQAAFALLWNSLHKPGFQWDDNPWCCALSFETHHANIDELREAA